MVTNLTVEFFSSSHPYCCEACILVPVVRCGFGRVVALEGSWFSVGAG